MNYIIKNGVVINPADGTKGMKDIWIKDGKIESGEQTTILEDIEVINAEGCYVMPGLIDPHAHMNQYGDGLGTNADLLCLPNGVVAAIDAGSCGVDNIEGFLRNSLPLYSTNVKALLHVVSGGQSIDTPYEEVADSAYFDKERILNVFDHYPRIIKGLKIRYHETCTKGFGLSPLKKMVQIAEYVESKGYHCPVVVHLGKLEEGISLEDLLNVLRSGDVVAHICQSNGETLLNSEGTVKTCVRQARERGIFFDLAHGRGNFTFRNIIKAAEDGFWPDMIGTDIHKGNIYKMPAFTAMSTMTMMHSLGMPLENIVKAMTVTPARVYHMEPEFGRLSVGTLANLAVIGPVDKQVKYIDKEGTVLVANQYFTAKLTICSGSIQYRTMEI